MAVRGRSRMNQLEKRVDTEQEKQGACRWDEMLENEPQGKGGQKIEPKPTNSKEDSDVLA